MIAVALGIFAGLCWGLHDLAAKRFAAETGPFRMGFWVMVFGFLALLPIVLWRGTIWHATVEGAGIAALMGLCYACAVGSLFKAFSLAPVSVVGPFTAGYPTLVIFWNIANGLSPNAAEWLALGLTVAGAVVVARTGASDGGLNVIRPGQLKTVIFTSCLASLSFATTIVLGQKGAAAVGEFETTFISRLPAALVLLPLALGERPGTRAIAPFAWGGLMFMAMFDVAAVSAVNAAGLLPGAQYSAMGISLYGGFSVLLAMVFLKEKVSAGQWFGIALVILGVAIIGWPDDLGGMR
jgi:drug/metabolite transporter (DMT)-like permease